MKSKLKLISLIALLPLTTNLTARPLEPFSMDHEDVQCIATAEEPYRLIASKDIHGRTVELDDGSIWSIHGAESQTYASRWRANDSVVIHPTLFPLWAGTQFYLYNERTKTAANAILSANPYANTATHVVINYIDYMRGDLHIVDGSGRNTYCRVNPKFYTELSRWRVGNTILIGSNQDCYAGWFSDFPYILINVERRNHGFVEAIFE